MCEQDKNKITICNLSVVLMLAAFLTPYSVVAMCNEIVIFVCVHACVCVTVALLSTRRDR